MKVKLTAANPSLISILKDPNQIITLDANFLIPPNRPRLTNRGFDFQLFKKIWLDPIFKTFPMLAIHESVYDELVLSTLREYVDCLRNQQPPRIIIHRDDSLTEVERIVRD